VQAIDRGDAVAIELLQQQERPGGGFDGFGFERQIPNSTWWNAVE